MKEKQISELILKYKLLKKRFFKLQCFQEQNRKELKIYEDANRRHPEEKYVENYLRYIGQVVFENKVLLNALQKQCIAIKKKIKKLNKEQNFRNNKN